MSRVDTLKAILASSAFDRLSEFKEPALWETMTHDERELLGILFVKQGEKQLQQGDSSVLESFDIASRVAPHSPNIFFQQAVLFSTQGQNMRCLTAASEALRKATEIDPIYFNAWHAWGNVLMRLGLFNDSIDSFVQADEKFRQAEALLPLVDEKYAPHLYWHWGLCWYQMGKYSGEAVDFFRALEKFRQGEDIIDAAEFYNDYGNALVGLATLIGREEMYFEAIDQYEKATRASPLDFEGWHNLGITYQRLYLFSLSKEYFFKADEFFETAADKAPDNDLVWLRWGELYLTAGRTYRDIDRINAAIDKLSRADAIDPDNPYLALRWGEALMNAASYTEDLEKLREAESKIGSALKALPNIWEVWYIYGLCLYEYGRYFASIDYYLKAIERFEQGLRLRSACPSLLQGLAMTNLAIGELQGKKEYIERAAAYFSQAGEACGPLSPQLLSDWGIVLMKLGEMSHDKAHVELAATKFEEAINQRLELQEGEDVELEWLYNYGCAMDFLGDFHDEPIYYEKAVQVLSHVLKHDPEYIHARYNLALALTHLGELNCDIDCFHQSIEHLQIVLEHDTEDELAWNDLGMAFLNLAVLTNDDAQKDNSLFYFAQAEQKLLHAITLGSMPAFYNLACAYALTGRKDDAIHFLEKAEQADVLPYTDDVIHDEWLDNLRDHKAYRMFIARLLNKQEQNDDSNFDD